MREKSRWKKYYPKEIWRYIKLWWLLRSQKRYDEASRILKIYRYPPFWVPVIGFIVLYLLYWPDDKVIDLIPDEFVPIDGVTELINWEYVRKKALNRTVVTNFREAKKKLYLVHEELGLMKTFYCGCSFTLTPKRHDRESCGLVLTKYVNAWGIDAEHVVPESIMGKGRLCWREGGRKACEEDSKHQLAAGDLFNLVPSVPGINRLRSNYRPVDDIPGEAREFGICDIEIEKGRFEPPLHLRGIIARTYLYMWHVYNVPLTVDDVERFKQWHQSNPFDKEEIAIAQAKARIQGNVNPFYLETNF